MRKWEARGNGKWVSWDSGHDSSFCQIRKTVPSRLGVVQCPLVGPEGLASTEPHSPQCVSEGARGVTPDQLTGQPKETTTTPYLPQESPMPC